MGFDERMRSILVVLFPLIAVAGCIPIPLEYSGPSIPDMPQEVRDKIVAEGWTREQVIAALGSPDATHDEARAIGYWRCDPYEILVIPYFMKEYWETCFLCGFWFDADGHAVKQGVSAGTSHRTQDVRDYGPYLACPEAVWLSKPGGGCPKE